MTFQAKIPHRCDMMWFLNVLACIPVSARTSADGLSVVKQWAPFGDSPPLHIHHTQDEVFVVHAGWLPIRLDGQGHIPSAGESLLAPKGVPHTYRDESTGGAHFTAITRGPDFESLVLSAGRPAPRADLPEAAAPTPEAIARLTRQSRDAQIELLGPPLH